MKTIIILLLAMVQRLGLLLLAAWCAWLGMWPMSVFLCVCTLILDVPREK